MWCYPPGYYTYPCVPCVPFCYPLQPVVGTQGMSPPPPPDPKPKPNQTICRDPQPAEHLIHYANQMTRSLFQLVPECAATMYNSTELGHDARACSERFQAFNKHYENYTVDTRDFINTVKKPPFEKLDFSRGTFDEDDGFKNITQQVNRHVHIDAIPRHFFRDCNKQQKPKQFRCVDIPFCLKPTLQNTEFLRPAQQDRQIVHGGNGNWNRSCSNSPRNSSSNTSSSESYTVYKSRSGRATVSETSSTGYQNVEEAADAKSTGYDYEDE